MRSKKIATSLRDRLGKPIGRAAYAALIYCLDAVIFRLIPTTETPGTVLIVRPDRIGDFVLWSRMTGALRDLYRAPTHRLILVANSAWAGLADALGAFDEVVAIDVRRFTTDIRYRYAFVGRLRRMGADTVIHPTFSRTFWLGDAIVRLSGARTRLGSKGDHANIHPWMKRLSDRWYTRLVPATPNPLTEIERNAEFMQGLGADIHTPAPPWVPDEASRPTALSGIAYFVIVPGASWSGKCWPVTHFGRLLRRIHKETGWVPVLCGGSEDGTRAAEITAVGAIHAIDLTGRTTIRELAATLAGARLVLSNDTAAVHLAAATGVPSVCILGGGHFGRFLPYPVNPGKPCIAPLTVAHHMECFGCNWRCHYEVAVGDPVPCISAITVESVENTVLDLLNRIDAEGK